jgi:hypothetical protein
MSVVISVTAMIPTRYFLAIISRRMSGRLPSMNTTMSRATSKAASGTFSELMTGIPCASTYFL